MAEVVRANPTYRRYCCYFLALLAVAGAAVVYWGRSALIGYLTESPTRQSLRLVRWLLTGLFTPCVIIAGYLVLVAGRVRRAGQFPPPGMVVVRDTTVQRGAAARKVSGFLVATAVVLILAGAFAGYYLPWVLLSSMAAK